jgi:hypothetical protein
MRFTSDSVRKCVMSRSRDSAASAVANCRPWSVCWRREALPAVGSRCCEFLSEVLSLLPCDEVALSRLPCDGAWSRRSYDEAALLRMPYDEAWS